MREDVRLHVAARARQQVKARLEVSLVNEKGNRLNPLLQRDLDHHARLCHEHAALRYEVSSHLVVCESCKDVEATVGQIGEPHYANHVHTP